jgi:hypothetical protein
VKLIETKTLTVAAASIEFTSIPQDGTDLVLMISSRSAGVGGGSGINLRPNGFTTNATRRILFGSGSTVGSNTDSVIFAGFQNGSGETANTFNNACIYIPNYAGSTNKSFSSDSVMENNATAAFQGLVAALWSSTAAITSITLVNDTGSNFVVNSVFSLYKITKGSDGIVTVS